MSKKIRKGRVLYFYLAASPFVDKDVEIIKRDFEVKTFMFNVYAKKQLVLTLVKQFFFLLKNIFWFDIVVCQFAGIAGVLPVLFSRLFFKRAVIVAGGTDCVSFPSINYGNFSNKRNAVFTGFCFKNADLILPVHQSLIFTDYTYQPNDFKHQGIKSFIPKLKTRYFVIHNGYSSEYWRNNGKGKNKDSFVTVLGHVNSRFTLLLKGIDLYIEMARNFPEANFSIVGGAPLIIENKPDNLELLPNIWGEKMIDVYSAHRFYVQLSMSEGFPNALSEAMLCECVPVVSNVGGMPDIVNDCGYILKQKKLPDLIKMIDAALKNMELDILGKKARERIRQNYTIEKRTSEFLEQLDKLL